MTEINLDQAIAHNEEAVSFLIQSWRESLARKRQRHGDSFDEVLAMMDLGTRLSRMPREAAITILISTINRLANMPDYNPVPDEIAGLDFEVDLETPEGGESDGDQ